MAETRVAIPGETLGPASKYNPGPGTHISGDNITSSIMGHVVISPAVRKSNSSSKPTLAVHRPTHPPSRPPPILPTVGSIVHALITRLTPTHAHGTLLTIDSYVAAPGLRGIVRAADVRATQKDAVVPAACFRVGDVVRAAVVSAGDQGGYFLTTAANDLGVVMAWSEDGNVCVPVAWAEVRDQVTGKTEARKVAKPF